MNFRDRPKNIKEVDMDNENLKPLDFGGIFDRTFRLTFSNLLKNIYIFAIYLAIGIAALLVIAGIAAFLIFSKKIDPDFLTMISSFRTFDFSGLQDSFRQILQILISLIPVFIVFMIFFIIVQIFYLGIVNDIFIKSITGESWDLKTSFALVAKKFWTLTGAAFICVFIVIGGLCLCCVGVFPAVIISSLVCPLILFENLKVTSSISRSFKMISLDFWPSVGTYIVCYLIILAINYGSSFIIGIFAGLSNFFFKSQDTNDVYFHLIIQNLIIYILMIPVSIFVQALQISFFNVLFFNLKVKFENYGVEMMALSITDKGGTSEGS
jgi:hypothetical protein